MPREDKPTINITNRPSRKRSHTSGEWLEHMESRETIETRRDIVDARQRLGQFTARFIVEALCAGERDGERLAEQMLQYVDENQLIDDMSVDPRELKRLAQNVGGARANHVVKNSVLRELADDPRPSNKTAVVEGKSSPDVGQQQVELLRALLKTMDPEVVKRALTGG